MFGDNDGNYQNMVNNDGKGAFDIAEDRLGFIRKVYGILACELSVTALFVAIAGSSTTAIDFMYSNPALLILALVTYFATACALFCSRSLARSVPTNYILLSIFTCSISYIVAFVTT